MGTPQDQHRSLRVNPRQKPMQADEKDAADAFPAWLPHPGRRRRACGTAIRDRNSGKPTPSFVAERWA
jgi:hypothetical protein